MNPIEQLKSVLCDPEGKCCIDGSDEDRAVVDKALQALAQPEQEPVVWMTPAGEGFRIRFSPPVNDVPLGWDALYTTPPQRTWVGLSESDRRLINFQWQDGNGTATEIIDLVEAKLKEKNNGHN